MATPGSETFTITSRRLFVSSVSTITSSLSMMNETMFSPEVCGVHDHTNSRSAPPLSSIDCEFNSTPFTSSVTSNGSDLILPVFSSIQINSVC